MSPGFTPRPSLSGQCERIVGRACVRRVAGVHAPAFVERGRPPASCGRTRSVAGVHAPAFVERRWSRGTGRRCSRVAGVHAPAFVERSPASTRTGSRRGVSPGFTPRPSLSGHGTRLRKSHRPPVSPGFTPRPSLSDQQGERLPPLRGVSPGFTPRPSLSGVAGASAPAAGRLCRRGSRPGLR